MIIVTITDYKFDNGYNVTYKKQIHTESFDKFGAFLLFAQRWFKAQGVNRTPYVVLNKTVRPKEYNMADMKFDLNWYVTEDFSQYTEKRIMPALRNLDMYNEDGAYLGCIHRKDGTKRFFQVIVD